MLNGYGSGTRSILPWLSAALILALSTPSDAQEKPLTPPAPKEPSSVLRPLTPVRAAEIGGRASIPEGVKLGFGLDVADKVIAGEWDVQGVVAASEPGRLVFKTDKGEAGNLVYRIPKEQLLRLAAGDPVAIKRKAKGFKAALGYELMVSSSQRTIIASGRLFGETPLKAAVMDGLVIEQGKEPVRMLGESKYEITHEIPVAVTAGDGPQMHAETGAGQEVTVKGRKYQVLVQTSNRVVPTKKYGGLAEGSEYVLEYVVLAR